MQVLGDACGDSSMSVYLAKTYSYSCQQTLSTSREIWYRFLQVLPGPVECTAWALQSGRAAGVLGAGGH